jgi:hypothetical protein
MKRLSLFSFLLMLFAVVLTSSCAKEAETSSVANLEVENRMSCVCNQLLTLGNPTWMPAGSGCELTFTTAPNAPVTLIVGCNEPSTLPPNTTTYQETSNGAGLVKIKFDAVGYTSVNIIVGGRCITVPIGSGC